MRPRIAITSNFSLDEGRRPPRERLTLIADYFDAVALAGGLPLPLPVPTNPTPVLIDELLDNADGLLLNGGEDLDPANYGESRHPQTAMLHPRRDRFELALFRRADDRRMPMLAICLGYQVAHVARGGRLHQHVDDLRREPPTVHHYPDHSTAYHTVRIAGDSHLRSVVGDDELRVNSRHHQAVRADALGAGLRTVATAPDGVLEASEDMRGRFLLAVQWHPENMIDQPAHLRLFEALVAAAGKHARQR